jgi:hypothetical protein
VSFGQADITSQATGLQSLTPHLLQSRSELESQPGRAEWPFHQARVQRRCNKSPPPGILKSRPSSTLWTADYHHSAYLTGVPCVMGEYAHASMEFCTTINNLWQIRSVTGDLVSILASSFHRGLMDDATPADDDAAVDDRCCDRQPRDLRCPAQAKAEPLSVPSSISRAEGGFLSEPECFPSGACGASSFSRPPNSAYTVYPSFSVETARPNSQKASVGRFYRL